ncbi:protein rep [Candidatus Pacearchaeota archaeon]|nr:protein rep [Candidatus Pacearchaeota archaeon]
MPIWDLVISTYHDGHKWLSLACGCCGESISVPASCGNRFCSTCGRNRIIRVKRRLTWLLEQIKLRPGERVKMLTLTLISEHDLPAMVDNLIKSFRKLRNRKYWRETVSGGAFVIEITKSDNGWHAHIHAVIQSYFMDWTLVRRQWRKITGASGVFVQNIPIRAAINYTTKYLTKGNEDPLLEQEISDSLKGRRLFNPFGTWHAIDRTYDEGVYQCKECGGSWFICLDFLDKYPDYHAPLPPPDNDTPPDYRFNDVDAIEFLNGRLRL